MKYANAGDRGSLKGHLLIGIHFICIVCPVSFCYAEPGSLPTATGAWQPCTSQRIIIGKTGANTSAGWPRAKSLIAQSTTKSGLLRVARLLQEH